MREIEPLDLGRGKWVVQNWESLGYWTIRYFPAGGYSGPPDMREKSARALRDWLDRALDEGTVRVPREHYDEAANVIDLANDALCGDFDRFTWGGRAAAWLDKYRAASKGSEK